MLPNILHCTGQSPAMKNYTPQNVNDAEVRKACIDIIQHLQFQGFLGFLYFRLDSAVQWSNIIFILILR